MSLGVPNARDRQVFEGQRPVFSSPGGRRYGMRRLFIEEGQYQEARRHRDAGAWSFHAPVPWLNTPKEPFRFAVSLIQVDDGDPRFEYGERRWDINVRSGMMHPQVCVNSFSGVSGGVGFERCATAAAA
jgi:hypothetical protein